MHGPAVPWQWHACWHPGHGEGRCLQSSTLLGGSAQATEHPSQLHPLLWKAQTGTGGPGGQSGAAGCWHGMPGMAWLPSWAGLFTSVVLKFFSKWISIPPGCLGYGNPLRLAARPARGQPPPATPASRTKACGSPSCSGPALADTAGKRRRVPKGLHPAAHGVAGPPTSARQGCCSRVRKEPADGKSASPFLCCCRLLNSRKKFEGAKMEHVHTHSFSVPQLPCAWQDLSRPGGSDQPTTR